jgi:hypothetical protein
MPALKELNSPKFVTFVRGCASARGPERRRIPTIRAIVRNRRGDLQEFIEKNIENTDSNRAA